LFHEQNNWISICVGQAMTDDANVCQHRSVHKALIVRRNQVDLKGLILMFYYTVSFFCLLGKFVSV